MKHNTSHKRKGKKQKEVSDIVIINNSKEDG